MAVDQQSGSGGKARIHIQGLPGIELDQDKTQPGGAIAFGFGLEFTQEGLLEFEDLDDVHAGDERLGGSMGGVSEQNIFKFVGAGREDGSALVDLGRIEQVEDGKVLDGKNFVHTFEAEAALSVQEVGDMGLLESGLLRQPEAGQFTCFDAVPKDFTKVILQDFELHCPEYSTGLLRSAEGGSFPQAAIVHPTLTEKNHNDTISDIRGAHMLDGKKR